MVVGRTPKDDQRDVTGRYEVLWTSSAGRVLGVTPTSVVEAARRHEARFGQRVMWTRNEASELGSAVVHADWVRERARALRGQLVQLDAHIMVLPKIHGLATIDPHTAIDHEIGTELATRMQEALAVAESNAREAAAERLARVETDAGHARQEAERLRRDLAVARRVIAEMAGVFGGSDGPAEL